MAKRGLGKRAGGMLRAWLLGGTALLPASGAALAQAVAPNARPTGGNVVAGSASIAQGANRTTITQSSQRAAVEWQQFNVGAQQSVQFVQPNAQAATLNRVVGPDPSVIAGRISATTPDGGRGGMVAIVNQSGVVFANGSQVSVGSLIASAANITNQNFMAGNMVFDGAARPGARVENHGTITVADRGLAALVGPRVANTGLIQGRLARVALQGGAEAYSLDLAGDGMLAIDVTQAVRSTTNGVALATNSGIIEAPGGSVLISAHAASGLVEDLVRNTGRISANTARGRTGEVALRAEGGNVRVEGTVEARGTGRGQRGGSIAATATGGDVTVAAGARVDASGRAGGGAVQVGGRGTRNAAVAGRVAARGGHGASGGQVAVQAQDTVRLGASARVDVSGGSGGGTALIGTEGVGRNQVMAARTDVAAGAAVRADARHAGNGGTIVVNSTERTTLLGSLSARGGGTGGDGGFVEVSSLGQVVFPDMLSQVRVDAPAGQAGTLLLDPRIIVIAASGAAVSGDIAAGDAALDGPPNTTTTLSASSVSGFTGNLLLEAERRITVSAAVNKAQGTLTLQTTSNAGSPGIFIEAGLTVTAGLTLNSAAGVTVTTGGGKTGTISTSTLAVTAADSIALNGTVGATTSATLTATAGSITQTAAITTPLLSVTAGTAVTLNRPNQVASVSGSATTDFSFTSARALSVGSVSAPVVSLTGTSLNLAAPVSGTTSVALTATTGNITQTGAGTITTPALTATATSGAITLDNAAAANQITALTSASAQDAIAIRSDVATFTVDAASGRGLTLSNGTTGGTLSITGNATARRATGGSQDATLIADAIDIAGSVTGATVTVRPFSDDTAVSVGGTPPIASTLVLSGATLGNITADTLALHASGTGAISVDAAISRGSNGLELRGTSVTQLAGADITAGTLRAIATDGAVDLTTAASNAVSTIAGSAAAVSPGTTGDFAFTNGAGFAVGGIAADGAVALTALAGGITQSAAITGTTLTATATGAAGAVTLTNDANAVSSIAGAATGGFAFTNSADVVAAGIAAGGAVALTAVDGTITQTAGITGTALTATATGTGGAVTLTGPANDVTSIAGASAGDFAFVGSNLGGLAIGAAGIAAGAGATVDLVATAGALTQGGAITGGVALRAVASAGAVDLGSTVNEVTTVAGSASTSFAIGSAGPLKVGTVGASAGIATTTTLDLHAATGDVTQALSITAAALRAQADAGRVVLTQAGNAIGTVAGSARDGFAVTNATGTPLSVGTVLGTQGIGLTGVGTVALRADAMTIGNRIAAPGGVIDLAPTSASVTPNVFLGAPDIGLSLDSAALGLLGGSGATGDTVPAERLRISSSGFIVLNGDVALRGRINTLELQAPIQAPVQVGGNLDVPRLVANAGLGFVVANAGSTNLVDELAVRVASASGPVTMVSASPGGLRVVDDTAVSGVNGIGGAANLAISLSAASLDLAAPVAGGTVTLAADGAITQSAGTLAATTLSIHGLAGAGTGVGSVQLDRAGNQITTLAAAGLLLPAVAATGDVAIRSDVTSFAVTGPVSSATGDVTLTNGKAGGTLSLGGAVTAAPTGTVTLTADSLSFGLGTSVSAGTAVLAPSSGFDVAVDGVAGPGVMVISGAQLAAISAQTLVIGSTAARDVTFFASRSFPGVNTLHVIAGRNIGQASGAALNVTTLRADAGQDPVFGGGSVALASAVNVVTNFSARAGAGAGDAVRLITNGPIHVGVGGIGIDAGGAVFLGTFGGDITQTAPIAAAALTAITLGGSVALDSLPNQVAALDGSATNGFRFRNATGFEIGTAGSGSLTGGGAVVLTADAGGITQSVVNGGAITGTSLSVTASGGAVDLGAVSNTLPSVQITAGGDVAYADTSSFVLAGMEAAGHAVTLRSDSGSITQSAAINAASLRADAPGGSVLLDALTNTSPADNTATSIRGSAAGTFAYRGTGSLDILAAGISAGAVRLTAAGGGIVLNGAVGGGSIALTALGGDITQSAAITGGSLTANASGNVDLATQDNALGSVGGSAGAGGSFAYRDLDDVTVGGISVPGGTVTLTAVGGGIDQSGSITAATLDVTAGGTVSLGLGGNNVASLGIDATGGDVIYRDANGFDVTGISAPGRAVTLTAAGNITQSGEITGASLSATTTSGTVTLADPQNAVGSVAGSAPGGFTFRDSDSFTVTGITATGGAVSLRSDSGDIGQSAAGKITAGTTLNAVADAGGVDLDTAANAAGTISGSARDRFAYQGDGSFGVAGITVTAPAGTARLVSAGDITQSAAISAASLSVQAATGLVDLATQQNLVGRIDGLARDGFAFQARDSLVVDGLSVTAGPATLISANGGITQTGAISATGLTVTATNGTVDLGAFDNAVGPVTATAGGGVTLQTLAGMQVLGIDAGGAVDLTASGGDITQTGQIRGTSLVARAPAGAVALDSLANTPGVVSGSALTGFAYRGTAGVAVQGGGIDTAFGTVRLEADGGDVTQTARIAAPALSASASGAVDLRNAANALGSVGGDAVGSFAVRSSSGFDVAGIAAGTTVDLIAGGGITQIGGAISGTVLTVDAAGRVELATQANQLAAIDIAATAGDLVAFHNAGGFTVRRVDAPGSAVTLSADLGDIVQGPAGAITGTALTAQALAGNVLLETVANSVGAVDGGASGDFRFRNTTGFDAGVLSAGGDVALTANGGTGIHVLGIGAGGDVTLTALGGDITQTGAITGARLSATAPAGDVLLNAAANQLGTVGGSAGGDYRFGNTGGFTVSGITAAGAVELASSSGSIGQTGSIGAASLDARATAAGQSVALDGVANSVGQVSGAAADGFALLNDRGVVVAGISAGTVADLRTTSGNITQTAAITAPQLRAQAAGDVALDAVGVTNLVGTVAGSASGIFALHSGQPLSVGTVLATAGIAAPTIDLRATSGDLTQTAPLLASAGLRARADAGSVVLTDAGNAVATLAGSAAGDFRFANQGTLTVGNVLGTAGIVSTAAGASTIALATSAGGDIMLGAGMVTALGTDALVQLGAAGTVRQTAGLIATRRLEVQAGAGVQLGGANQFDQLTGATVGPLGGVIRGQSYTVTGAVTSGGGLALQAAGALTVGSGSTAPGIASTGGGLVIASDAAAVVIGASSLQALGGDLVVTGPGGIAMTGTTATVGGAMTVDAGSGGMMLNGVTANVTGPMTLTALAGGISMTSTGATVGGAMTVDAGSGGLTLNGMTANVTGPMSLTGSGITMTATTATVGGAMTVDARLGALTLSGVTANVTGPMSLTGSGIAMTSTTATVGGAMTVDAGPGALTLNGVTANVAGPMAVTGSGIAISSSGVTVGGAMTADAGSGGLTLNGVTANVAGPMSLLAGPGGIVMTGSGASVGGAMTLAAVSGGIFLTSNAVTVGGALTLTAGPSGMTLNGLTANVGSLAATAGGGMTLSSVQATGQGVLGFATQGNLNVSGSRLTSNGANPIDGVSLAAAGSATVLGSQLSAATRVNVVAQGPLSIDNTGIAADSAYLAGSQVSLGTVNASIGTDMLVAGPGGITNTAPLKVTPRTPDRFPMVVYDTRTVPLQTANAILGYVQPDVPGLQPNQQATQLRSGPGSQGPDPFFGLPVGTTAGSVSMNIQAGSSPVMLLLDGGSASGNIVAGRLLVHGTGGKVDLFGTLGGLNGAQAAQASDISRPAEPGSLSDYRINNCVISSINCVVTPRFQPIPPAVRTNVEFAFRQNAFNPADVIIPNTGENDYE